MSYDLIYGRCFISVKDSFIPMLVSGSSNCFEVTYNGRYKRERSFSVWTWWGIGERNRIATREQIEAKIKEWEDYNDNEYYEHYKQYGARKGILTDSLKLVGRSNTIKAFNSFIRGGMDRALTVEELIEYNINIIICSYAYNKEDLNGKEHFSKIPSTTQELIDFIKDGEEHIKDTKASLQIYFQNTCDYVLSAFTRHFKKEKSNLPSIKSLDEYYVITRDNSYCSYYSRGSRKGIYWVEYVSYARGFRRESEAKRRILQIKERMFYKDTDLVVKKISKNT